VSKSDPTHASLKLLLDGDNGDDIANPDNLDTSAKSLVIQEDREAEFRDVYNRVLVYDLKTGSLQPVARVNTPATLRPGTWESSGVINAFDILGAGWWLLDVQAHSTTAPQPGRRLRPTAARARTASCSRCTCRRRSAVTAAATTTATAAASTRSAEDSREGGRYGGPFRLYEAFASAASTSSP